MGHSPAPQRAEERGAGSRRKGEPAHVPHDGTAGAGRAPPAATGSSRGASRFAHDGHKATIQRAVSGFSFHASRGFTSDRLAPQHEQVRSSRATATES